MKRTNETKGFMESNGNVLIAHIALALIALLLADQVFAGLRCDCTQIISSCEAEVTFDEMEVEIESSNKACSRVDYLIDGQPFSSLVVDGEAEFDWNGQPLGDPQIVIENCRVCADTVRGVSADADSDEVAAMAETTEQGEIVAAGKPLIKIMPDYPQRAFDNRMEGTVVVEFSVSDGGVVQNIKVLESSSPLFVNAAIDAVSRFRYSPAATSGIQEEFRFRLLNGVDPVVTSATL